eukprot:2936525-Rhodomonas_salina.1
MAYGPTHTTCYHATHCLRHARYYHRLLCYALATVLTWDMVLPGGAGGGDGGTSLCSYAL